MMMYQFSKKVAVFKSRLKEGKSRAACQFFCLDPTQRLMHQTPQLNKIAESNKIVTKPSKVAESNKIVTKLKKMLKVTKL